MFVYRKQLSVLLTLTLSCDPFIGLVKMEMKYPEIANVSFSDLFSFFFPLQTKESILKVSSSKEAHQFTKTFS